MNQQVPTRPRGPGQLRLQVQPPGILGRHNRAYDRDFRAGAKRRFLSESPTSQPALARGGSMNRSVKATGWPEGFQADIRSREFTDMEELILWDCACMCECFQEALATWMDRTGRTRDSGMQSEEWKAVLAIAGEISMERWGSPLRMNAIRWGCRLAERLQRKFVMEGIRHSHAFKDHRDSARRLRPVMSPREDGGGLTTGTDGREKEPKRGRSPFLTLTAGEGHRPNTSRGSGGHVDHDLALVE